MKKILIIAQIIIIACISSGCVMLHLRREPGRRYYQGYIYTLDGQPIQGLWVGSGAITDERGFFKFKQNYWMSDLIVHSEEKTLDSIDLCRSGPRRLHWKPFPWQKDPLPGCFDERSTDTFFVDMDGEGRSFTVRQGKKRSFQRRLAMRGFAETKAECLEEQAQDSASETVDTLPAITYGTLTDERDGRTYRTVKIGGMTWMAQNLNYKPQKGLSWCLRDDTTYGCNKYGRLYDWNTAQNACPVGYHLPSAQEWDSLAATAGGEGAAGKKLKAKSGWCRWCKSKCSGNGTDDYGFSALPGGNVYFYTRRYGASDANDGSLGFWWTATEYDKYYADYRTMSTHLDDVDDNYFVKSDGYSVRCVADNP